MGLVAALWLQADDLGRKSQPYTPGSESGFSRIVIGLFIAAFLIAIGIAVYYVVRGCLGALRTKRTKQ